MIDQSDKILEKFQEHLMTLPKEWITPHIESFQLKDLSKSPQEVVIYIGSETPESALYERLEILELFFLVPSRCRIRTIHNKEQFDRVLRYQSNIVYDILCTKYPIFDNGSIEDVALFMKDAFPEMFERFIQHITGYKILRIIDQTNARRRGHQNNEEIAKDLILKYSCGFENNSSVAIPSQSWFMTFDANVGELSKVLSENKLYQEGQKTVQRLSDCKRIWNDNIQHWGFKEGIRALDMCGTNQDVVLDFAEALGINSMVKAYYAGVPISDILADI